MNLATSTALGLLSFLSIPAIRPAKELAGTSFLCSNQVPRAVVRGS